MREMCKKLLDTLVPINMQPYHKVEGIIHACQEKFPKCSREIVQWRIKRFLKSKRTNHRPTKTAKQKKSFNAGEKKPPKKKKEPNPPQLPPSPWAVLSLTEFLQYKCPSCDFTCKEEPMFIDHAYQYHQESVVYLCTLPTTNCSLEQTYHDGYENTPEMKQTHGNGYENTHKPPMKQAQGGYKNSPQPPIKQTHNNENVPEPKLDKSAKIDTSRVVESVFSNEKDVTFGFVDRLSSLDHVGQEAIDWWNANVDTPPEVDNYQDREFETTGQKKATERRKGDAELAELYERNRCISKGVNLNCEKCGYKALNWYQMKFHVEAHEGATCPHCKKHFSMTDPSYTPRSQLKNHLRHCKGEPKRDPKVCPKCGRRFERRQTIFAHKKICGAIWKCDACNTVFSTKRRLNLHKCPNFTLPTV